MKLIKTISVFAICAAASSTSIATTSPDPLKYVVDERTNYTEDCNKGWYLTEQREPIFSRGLPPYQVMNYFQFSKGGVKNWDTRIKSYPTDFGARTHQNLSTVEYVSGLDPKTKKYSTGDTEIGMIVSVKHVGLVGNDRKSCVFAEVSMVDGYTMQQSPVTGSFQQPVIHVRRYVGEVESGKNSWIDLPLGSDGQYEASLKVDVMSSD